MSNVFSRACTLLVVVGGFGMGACASPSAPSVTPSGETVSAGLTTAATRGQGLTDLTLVKAGWVCRTLPDRIICAPPGLGFPPVPPIPNNGGAPTYHLIAFTLEHQFLDSARFIRPDLYQGQPCLGDEPWIVFPRNGYYECLDPAE